MTVWKPVPGYEKSHEVSSSGQVRSLTRKRVSKSGRPYTVRGRIMRPDIDKDGYHIYRLTDEGRRWTVKCHRLVASVFIGPCPDGMQVAHEDGDPGNNDVTNLRYDTCKGNHFDKYRHGTMQRGSRHGRSKMTEQDALYIRSSMDRADALAKIYGVDKVQIYRIRRGETWAHV